MEFIASSVGIKDPFVEESEIKVFPNPSYSFVKFSGNYNEYTWRKIDLSGQELLRETGETADISSIADGIYTVIVNGESKKLVKW